MRNYFESPIRTVSAECGTGKTRAACNFIRQRLAQSNYLYIAPTKRLLRQTQKTLSEFGVRSDVIDGDSHANVNAALTNALKDAPGEGDVRLITWHAYSHLTYFHEPEYWTRIIDEVPQLDDFYAYTLPFNHRFLTEHIEIKRSVNEHISEVRAKDRWALKYFLQKPKDDVHEQFRALLEDLLLPGKTVFVDSGSWTRITEQQVVSRDEQQNRIFFLTMLNPGLFEDAILLGANIKNSMTYDWLRRFHRCRFAEEPNIAQNLRALPASLAGRLEINHFGFVKLFSKYQGRQACEDGGFVLSKMEDEIVGEFGSRPFLFTLNKDRDDTKLLEAGGTRLPAIAHGLNEFQTFKNLFFGAALNREPKHHKMLLDLGFTHERIQNPALEVIYQSMMRSALRDFGSKEPVRVAVADTRSAEYLQSVIGPCKVRQIGSLAPAQRPRRLTQLEKDRRARAAKDRKELLLPKTLPGSLINEGGSDLEWAKQGNLSEYIIAVHDDLKAFQLSDFTVNQISIQNFIQKLRTSAHAAVIRKEDQYLFTSAIFKLPEEGAGWRRQNNFLCSFYMVLDFDNGKLSPDEFVRIFWTDAVTAAKRSFIICNTFSRSKAEPNRFRVILLYRRPATSIEQHQAVFDAVVSRLEKHGFTQKAAKLDAGGRSGIQSHFMPGTNKEHSDYAFFDIYGTKTTELARFGIDPKTYLRTSQPASVRAFSYADGGVVSTAEIDALAQQIQGMIEGRHNLFFELARKLASQYRDRRLVEQHLARVAGADRKLQKKAQDAVASLVGYGRL